ncbi:larval cuticle protein A2B-like [Uranotaenia lowii]|uniref:larval cuticle protein A2B-like n=1 Tax=Uranotaenia lowii TaxID=190385 RepID=UPI00247AC11D|nr:larval cuticle protein A2B-like [Uranotaenia lowii]
MNLNVHIKHQANPTAPPPIDAKINKLSNEINTYPEYEFAYGVKDPITGDHKDQWEKRSGDHVQGIYMFEEADGTQRIVEYEADDKNGFRAKVINIGRPDSEAAAKIKAHYGRIATSYSMLKKKL